MNLSQVKSVIISFRQSATDEELTELIELLNEETAIAQNRLIVQCGNGKAAVKSGNHASQKGGGGTTAIKIDPNKTDVENTVALMGLNAESAIEAGVKLSRVATLMSGGMSEKEAIAAANKGGVSASQRDTLKTREMMSDKMFERINPDMTAIRQELKGTGITAKSDKELFARYARYNEIKDSGKKDQAITEAKALRLFEKGQAPKRVTTEDLIANYLKR